jgi:hypothetical protein
MGNKHVEVDLKGLAKLLERKGLHWLALELLQNALDTKTTVIDLTMTAIPNRPMVELVITDEDPDGFLDLSHAYTLFAESTKKDDPELRGRFNFGEKLVLAYALAYGGEVEISTTKGTILFDDSGRHSKRLKRSEGSQVRVIAKLTRSQMAEVEAAILSIIPPAAVVVTYNGKPLQTRVPVRTFTATLPTVKSDNEGILRPTKRKTEVEVYEVVGDEKPTIYEMGLPVVELLGDDKYHVNVKQKIPLNMDRDNVTPGYLKNVRVEVMNATHDLLDKEEAASTWATEALGDDRIGQAAVSSILDQRFGEKRVIADPSDPEATKEAARDGWTVIPGGTFGGKQWGNIKQNTSRGGTRPAGRVTGTSFGTFSAARNPVLDPSKYTDGMKELIPYIIQVGFLLTGGDIDVIITDDRAWGHSANYEGSVLTLNLVRNGHSFFNDKTPAGFVRVNSLLIHEFATHVTRDRLSSQYHSTLATYGAKLAVAVATIGADLTDAWNLGTGSTAVDWDAPI